MDLDELRKQIDACDEILIDSLARRLALVREVARAKCSGEQALFQRDREREVVSRAVERGKSQGVSGVDTESFMHSVIELSHVNQEAEFNRAAQHPKCLLIVGGAGRMGSRFGAEFKRRGHRVLVLELGEPVSAELVARADCVMLAVPMGQVLQVAGIVAPLVRPDALLVDINSLKQDVCRVMAEHCRGEVLGTHPMFGATVSTLRRQKVVLCPVRRGPLSEWFIAELGSLGLETVESDSQVHDRMMARVQALTHFSKLALGEAWRRGGIAIEETLGFVSPIYRLELAMVGRLFAQDPELYAEIEMENPWASAVRGDLVAAVGEVHALLSRGDRAGFSAFFARIRDYLRGFSDEALALSDRVVDDLVKRA